MSEGPVAYTHQGINLAAVKVCPHCGNLGGKPPLDVVRLIAADFAEAAGKPRLAVHFLDQEVLVQAAMPWGWCQGCRILWRKL